MDVSYDAKLNTVRQWLAALARQHGDVPLPAWRETPSAVDKLYLLYCKNKRNDEMCRRIISHTTSLTKQFESESTFSLACGCVRTRPTLTVTSSRYCCIGVIHKQTCERTYIVAITLQGSMASVGVAPEHLSVSGMMSLHSLTSLAMSLDLKDTVTSRYVRHRTVTPRPGGCRDVTHLECASEQLHDGIERYGAGGDRVESVA